MNRRSLMAIVAVVALAVGCGDGEDESLGPPPTANEPDLETDDEPVDLSELEAELNAQLATRDDDLGQYVDGLEAAGGNRVRVLTQLDESQTAEADAICNDTTVATSGLDDVEVTGVDVAAAGGSNIAQCEPAV